jgi:hypothetical protein
MVEQYLVECIAIFILFCIACALKKNRDLFKFTSICLFSCVLKLYPDGSSLSFNQKIEKQDTGEKKLVREAAGP